MLFRDAAVDSAQRYYHYLEKTGGGLVKTGIVHIEKDDEFYVLYLKSKLAVSDDSIIRIHNKDYSHEQILPVEYDEMRRTLRIRPHSSLCAALNTIQPQDIYVVSDLKFLVKRVEAWYEDHGEQLQIPYTAPSANNHDFPALKYHPSDDQNAAIKGVLSSPFSYVWGAPGTGKTRFVLARCILAYIMEGKKILIAAPTNNAVEQMLDGVLAVLKEAEIPLDRVLRLGLASSEFVSRYPSVCEEAAHAKRIAAIEEQIRADHRQLEETDKLLAMMPDRNIYQIKAARYLDCSTSLLPLFDELNALRLQEKELEDAAVVLKGEIILLDDKIKICKAKHGKAVDKVRQLTPIVEKYSHGIRKLLWSKKYEQTLSDLQTTMADEKRYQQEIDDLLQHLQSLHQKEKQLSESIKAKQADVQQCREKIRGVTAFWPDLQSVALKTMYREDMASGYPKMLEMLESVSTKMQRLEHTYQVLENTSEQELLDRKQKLSSDLAKHQEQLAKAEAQSTSARIQKCSVLAATIDRCIKDIPPNGDFIPDHVFLDEAGYCSLVKAVTLMAYGCPLTCLNHSCR